MMRDGTRLQDAGLPLAGKGQAEQGNGSTMSDGSRPWDIGQRTFAFAVQIVRFCRDLEGRSEIARTLSRQLLRSGTSIGANVEEAQAGQSRADFVSKYSIALKEARETIYWLRLVKECGEDLKDRCDPLRKEGDEIARIIASIILKAKAQTTQQK